MTSLCCLWIYKYKHNIDFYISYWCYLTLRWILQKALLHYTTGRVQKTYNTYLPELMCNAILQLMLRICEIISCSCCGKEDRWGIAEKIMFNSIRKNEWQQHDFKKKDAAEKFQQSQQHKTHYLLCIFMFWSLFAKDMQW